MPPLVAHLMDSEAEVSGLCTSARTVCESFLHNWEQASLCCCWCDNFRENWNPRISQRTDRCKNHNQFF